MPAPPEVISLVERFDVGFNEYKHVNYGETSVRVAFINPFFEALGWDMSGKNRREITHEYALDNQLTKLHPDYCFNAGGEGKTFFLEAKKPSVNLAMGNNPAHQLRRYSWTANHPIGALTDFEEFSVYYGRGIEPKADDGPDVARLFYCNFREYADKWDEIYAMFSRPAVLDGSLEQHAAVMKTKRGSQEVDAVFLNDIEAWRLLLAGHIASNNPDVTQMELNASVQQTIDRIIFLRICEDREIEPYGTLEKLLSGESVYQQLIRLFKVADSKYNSGLFYFKKDTKRGDSADTLSLGLKIQDEPLKQIIQRLYFPHGPYMFSVMPADILGQVYERFLGKAIQVQPDRTVVVEEKPEVRKAGGVYYTPTYIVDYIVRNTVGKLVDGKTPEDVSSMRVLDPACGSGSFLIRAYQYLLDWHLEWYLNNDPPKHIKCKPPKLYQDSNDHWHLTIHERKRILLNNIYGVDIDSQAVEVSKLSLLLKVLEGENSQSMTRQLSLFKERALPDLGDNIKCGNSLIGRDFYSGQQSLFTFEDRMKVNAFDWETEFADIMKAGGFDAVIGNPPYVRQELLTPFKSYFSENYQCYSGTADLYVYFYEKGLSLVKEYGYFTYISNSFTKITGSGTELRRFLKNNSRFISFADFSDVQIFDGATTYPVIITLKKEKEPGMFSYLRVKPHDLNQLHHSMINNSVALKQSGLEDSFWTFEPETAKNIKEKIKTNPTVKDVFGKCYYGIKTGLNEAFIISGKTKQSFISSNPIENDLMKPFLEGKDLKKWVCADADKWIILLPKGWTSNISGCKNQQETWEYITNKYPGIAGQLFGYKDKAIQRNDKGEFWWELRACAYYDSFNSPKIVWPNLQSSNKFSYDDNGFYINAPSVILPTNSKLLLCVVNSKLAWFFFKDICALRSGGYIEMKPQYFEQLPIAVPDDETVFSQKADIMLTENKELHELKADFLSFFKSELTPQKISQKLENWNELDREQFTKEMEKCKVKELRLKDRKEWQDYFIEHKEKADKIKSVIDTTDKEIDRLVYDLYDLTDDEIAIVEKK